MLLLVDEYASSASTSSRLCERAYIGVHVIFIVHHRLSGGMMVRILCMMINGVLGDE